MSRRPHLTVQYRHSPPAFPSVFTTIVSSGFLFRIIFSCFRSLARFVFFRFHFWCLYMFIVVSFFIHITVFFLFRSSPTPLPYSSLSFRTIIPLQCPRHIHIIIRRPRCRLCGRFLFFRHAHVHAPCIGCYCLLAISLHFPSLIVCYLRLLYLIPLTLLALVTLHYYPRRSSPHASLPYTC